MAAPTDRCRNAGKEDNTISESSVNANYAVQHRTGKIITAVAALLVLMFVALVVLPASGLFGATAEDMIAVETSQFNKHLDIWFMTFLIAIIMMFIKKFQWGVAVATLLSAATTYVVYFILVDFIEAPEVLWTQATLIRGAVAAITVVVGIGVFVGTVKSWEYLLIGVLFAPVYYAVEWCCGYFGDIMVTNGNGVMDPGGAILVHMAGAYFGLGVASAIRDKRVFDEPMYSTTHSLTFGWLASMLLFMLWPSFVTAFLEPADVSMATAVCYMAGMGSIISAYLTGIILTKKINTGIYAFALLAGCVCMSPVMLIIDPFQAVIWGMVGGVLSTLCFMYMQPWLCGKLGIVDVMGVHNLHGMCGWLGVILLLIMSGEPAVIEYALSMVVICFGSGLVIGAIVRLTKGTVSLPLDDREEFVFNEDPDHIEHDMSIFEEKTA